MTNDDLRGDECNQSKTAKNNRKELKMLKSRQHNYQKLWIKILIVKMSLITFSNGIIYFTINFLATIHWPPRWKFNIQNFRHHFMLLCPGLKWIQLKKKLRSETQHFDTPVKCFHQGWSEVVTWPLLYTH